MSLQVWLPLTSDLHNQGLSDYSISMFRGSETYNNSGKLGKCFYANGVNTIKIYNIIPDFYNYTSYSISAWFYIEARNTSHSGSAIISAGNWNSQVINLAVSDWSSDHYTLLRVSGTSWGKYYSYNFNLNTWYHVVVSSDGTKTYAYVNGTLVGDTMAGFLPTSIEGSDIAIGGATYYAGMQFFGRINDVRIYDECLSQKQIKLLSQGLVAHYALNGLGGGCNNLVPNQGSYGSESTAYTYTSASKDGYKWLTGSHFIVEPSTTYTISICCDGNLASSHNTSGTDPALKAFTIFLYLCNNDTTKNYNNGQYDTAVNLNSSNYNHQQIGNRHIWNYTTTSKQTHMSVRINNYSNGTDSLTIKYWQIKVEKGEKATSWLPNSSDPIYTALGYDDTTIYDCSGYNHHGSTLGTLTTSSDTARYSSSTVFDGSSSGVLLENFALASVINNDATLSFWIKPNGENGARSVYFSSYSLTSWSLEKTTGNVIRSYWNGSPDESCSGASISDGVWQHVCVTKKGTNEIKVYINGELKWTSTATHTTLNNLPTTYRLGRDTRTGATCYAGSMSDFRIYATSLSADDVLELYHTGASIDKNGNMYAYELKES